MKFIPYDKLSKKKKREADRARRGSWGGINPVTRRPDNPKAYKRKKIKLSDKDGELYLFRDRPVTKQSPSNGTVICAIMRM